MFEENNLVNRKWVAYIPCTVHVDILNINVTTAQLNY